MDSQKHVGSDATLIAELERRRVKVDDSDLARRHPEFAGRGRQRRARGPSIRSLIERAEKAGKPVSSITTPHGYTLTFGEPQPAEAANPWDEVLTNAPN